MLWTILVILLVLWLVGLLSNVGGGLIHLLLVVAVIVLVINLVTGRRAVQDLRFLNPRSHAGGRSPLAGP